jgi:hypothetical protein
MDNSSGNASKNRSTTKRKSLAEKRAEALHNQMMHEAYIRKKQKKRFLHHVSFFFTLYVIVTSIILLTSNKKTQTILESSGGRPTTPTYKSSAIRINSKWGFFLNGKELIAPKYDSVLSIVVTDDFSDTIQNGGMLVLLNDKWGLVNSDAQEIINPKYDSVIIAGESLAWVRNNQKWGLIKNSGDIILEPIYEYAYTFSNGYALIQQRGLVGAVNRVGLLVVPAIYDWMEFFSPQGIAIVLNGDNYIFINTMNEQLKIPWFDDYQRVDFGYLIKRNGKV